MRMQFLILLDRRISWQQIYNKPKLAHLTSFDLLEGFTFKIMIVLSNSFNDIGLLSDNILVVL